MSRRNGKPHSEPAPVVRCAIYTRKSTDEGLDQVLSPRLSETASLGLCEV